ncbi:MAG: DUF1972 domain-containing protein [Flavobacteriales bacterium]|nr:DUF1972 domain-containing protein [Flavobacteriales bacterium]
MKIAILGTRGIPNNYGGFEQCAEYLAKGLVVRGHKVVVYSPNFHPYTENLYEGIHIKKIYSPQKILGVSASNFVYDYLCFKDAVNSDFDIILELGLITSALSIIFCDHKDKPVVTNLDGLEWKRSKWNYLVQKISKLLEKYGVKYSDYLISDNIGIQSYVQTEYSCESTFIAYGALDIQSPNNACLANYGISDSPYFLSIARMVPENNLDLILSSYVQSESKIPYYIVGNYKTKYGEFLHEKYADKNIHFLGGVYNKKNLDNLRYFSKLYFHGHSVGGTNPSLLEAMAAKTLIVANDNEFNRSVLEENAFYFSSEHELIPLFNKNLDSYKIKFVNNNLKKINDEYRWSNTVDKYETLFEEILNSKQ